MKNTAKRKKKNLKFFDNFDHEAKRKELLTPWIMELTPLKGRVRVIKRIHDFLMSSLPEYDEYVLTLEIADETDTDYGEIFSFDIPAHDNSDEEKMDSPFFWFVFKYDGTVSVTLSLVAGFIFLEEYYSKKILVEFKKDDDNSSSRACLAVDFTTWEDAYVFIAKILKARSEILPLFPFEEI